jgi:hypothetical protein
LMVRYGDAKFLSRFVETATRDLEKRKEPRSAERAFQPRALGTSGDDAGACGLSGRAWLRLDKQALPPWPGLAPSDGGPDVASTDRGWWSSSW